MKWLLLPGEVAWASGWHVSMVGFPGHVALGGGSRDDIFQLSWGVPWDPAELEKVKEVFGERDSLLMLLLLPPDSG